MADPQSSHSFPDFALDEVDILAKSLRLAIAGFIADQVLEMPNKSFLSHHFFNKEPLPILALYESVSVKSINDGIENALDQLKHTDVMLLICHQNTELRFDLNEVFHSEIFKSIMWPVAHLV